MAQYIQSNSNILHQLTMSHRSLPYCEPQQHTPIFSSPKECISP
jgi:hypothetical protein